MKRILKLIIWIALVVLAIIAVVFMFNRHSKQAISVQQINIHAEPDNYLVSKDDIELVLMHYPDSILQQADADILKEIENKISSSPFIETANVYRKINGEININVSPREPIARIIDNRGRHLYMDTEGNLFYCNGKVAKAIVVNGQLPSLRVSNPYNTAINLTHYLSFKKNLKDIILYIREDEFLSSFIDQIYITRDYEFELIPKIGKHYIEFGSIDNMEEKFENLIAFYQQEEGIKTWGKYKKINVKYKNQVICSK